MKKKLFCTIIAMTLLLGCAAFGKIGNAAAEKEQFLLTESLRLTSDMDELADSKEYLSLFTVSDSIDKIASEIGKQDYTAPKSAYLLELPDDMLDQMAGSLGGNENPLKGMSESVLKKLRFKMNGSTLSNLINSYAGSEVLAVTSALTWGKSYLQPDDWSKNTVVLLLYDGNYSSMVSFAQSGDGIISASAGFVKNNELMEELKSTNNPKGIWEQLFGITGIKYQKYTSKDLKKILPDKNR